MKPRLRIFWMSGKPFYAMCACAFYLRMEFRLYFVIFFSFSPFSGLFFPFFLNSISLRSPKDICQHPRCARIHFFNSHPAKVQMLSSFTHVYAISMSYISNFLQYKWSTFILYYIMPELSSSIDIIANRIEKLVIYIFWNYYAFKMTHKVVLSNGKFINIDVSRRLLNFFRISAFSRYFSTFIFKAITVILLLCLAGKTDVQSISVSGQYIDFSLSYFPSYFYSNQLFFCMIKNRHIFWSSEISNVFRLLILWNYEI